MNLPTPGNLALELSPEQQLDLARILRHWLDGSVPGYEAPSPRDALARELLQLMEGK